MDITMEQKKQYQGLTADDNPIWITGNLVVELETNRHFIVDLSHFDEKTLLSDVMVEVQANTVSRCTGVQAKNKVLIFENDIVEITEEKGTVWQGSLVHTDHGWYVAGNINEYLKMLIMMEDLEITSNVFDSERSKQK